MKELWVGKTKLMFKPREEKVVVTVLVENKTIVEKELSKNNNALKWSRKEKEFRTSGHILARFPINGWPNALVARVIKSTNESKEVETFDGIIYTWK